MQKKYFDETAVKAWVHGIMRTMQRSGWRPDYIVGLTRGGLYPALLLSHYMEVPMHTLKVSLRDDDSNGSETNCWMSEDAYNGTNILIVDDINDTGATLEWIKQDWRSSCLPNEWRWETVWGSNVRVAVLINNLASTTQVDYAGHEINKAEDPTWIVFPWENWWESK